MRHPGRIVGRVAAGGLVVAVVVQGWIVGPASAEGLKAFDGSATAEGVRLSLSAQNAPVTNTPIDGTAPIAQAALDSLGSSEAFASSPYPGYYAVAGPGLIRALSQGQLDLPGYPLYARSEHPTAPQAQAGNPLVGLAAESSEHHARGVARSGPEREAATSSGGRQLSEATVRATEDRSEAIAEANSSVYEVQIGPLVLTDFHARARIVRSAGGEPVRTTSSSGHGRFGSAEFQVTDQGIVLAGQTLPGAPGPGTAVDAVNGQGASLTWLRPEADDRHVAAPVLLLSFRQDVPGNISPVQVSVIIGRAEVTLTTESLPEESPTTPSAGTKSASTPAAVIPPETAPSSPPSPPGPRLPAATLERTRTESTPVRPPTGQAPREIPGEDRLAAAPAPAVAPVPVSAASTASTAAVALAVGASTVSYRSTYAISALAGCAVLVGGPLLRRSSRKAAR